MVTPHDLRRLVRATGLPAGRLVKLYRPAEVEGDPSDRNWFRLSSGRRMLGLRQRRDRCLLLDSGGLCRAYDARPLLCRTFPHEFLLDADGRLRAARLRETVRDGSLACAGRVRGRRPRARVGQLAKQEAAERAAYWAKLEQWQARPRPGTQAQFLAFLGFRNR